MPPASLVVIVSWGAAVIQVSGARSVSVVGASALRQPIPRKARKRQRTAPTRKRIRALQHAQSLWKEVKAG
jgi:hypothetical protein